MEPVGRQEFNELRQEVNEVVSVVHSLADSTTTLAESQKDLRGAFSEYARRSSEFQVEVSRNLGKTGQVPIVWVFGAMFTLFSTMTVVLGLALAFMEFSIRPIERDVDDLTIIARDVIGTRVTDQDLREQRRELIDEITSAETDATRQVSELRGEVMMLLENITDRDLKGLEERIFRLEDR